MKFQLVFDLKGVLTERAAVEGFGYYYLLRSLREGRREVPRTMLRGAVAAITRKLSPILAYSFGDGAFNGATRELVESFAEHYARDLPRESLVVMRSLGRLDYEIFVITHDVRDLSEKAYERMGIEEENVIDNRFTWRGDRVSGIELIVDDKLHAYYRMIKEGKVDPKRCVIVGHSREEVPLASLARFAIGPKDSDSAFKRRAHVLYEDILELPRLLEMLVES